MPRGSKPGERRGGRKKGVPNKAGRELREVAQEYTATAMKTLAEICENGESEAARVAAANALLDRGHGKPTNLVVADVTERPSQPRHTESVFDTAAWIKSVLNDHKSTPHGSKKPNGAHGDE
jgi:hypothetical protein